MTRAMARGLMLGTLCAACEIAVAQEYVAGIFNTAGHPLPHASVAVLQREGPCEEECAIIWDGKPDDQGFVTIPLEPLPPGAEDTRIFAAKADGYAPSFLHEERLLKREETQFILGLRPTVYRNTGVVVDAQGMPIADAEIRFHDGQWGGWCTSHVFFCGPFWGTRTDEAGRFAYELPEQRGIGASVFHPRFARTYAALGRISDRDARPRPMTVTMAPGLQISGRVTCGYPPRPASQAVVRLFERPNTKSKSLLLRTTTDKSGYYVFAGLPLKNPPRSEFWLCVEHPRIPIQWSADWHKDLRFPWPLGQRSLIQNLHLPEGVALEGRVISNTTGEPVSGSWIAVEMPGTYSDCRVSPADDGSFRFVVLPGTVNLRVGAEIDGQRYTQHQTLNPVAGEDMTGLVVGLG